MVKCTFCGKNSDSHKGVHLIKNSGTIDYFCTNKCRMNATKLKRDKRKIRWTEAFHITRKRARERVKEAPKDKNKGPIKIKRTKKK